MQRLNFKVGGEQSGHILFTDLVESGDGLVTLLEYLKTLVNSKFTLLEKRNNIHFYHQKLTNVKAQKQKELIKSPSFKLALEEITKNHPDVRINVRASGTEPLIRILTESRDQTLVDNIASKIADLIIVNQTTL
jgi:phosphoglucosamine mutase